MKLTYLLAIFTMLAFVSSLLFQKEPRKFICLFILCFLPFMDLQITSNNYGNLKVFDGLCYISFFLFIRDFFMVRRGQLLYLVLIIILSAILILGSLQSHHEMYSLLQMFTIFPVFIFSKLMIDEIMVNPPFLHQLIRYFKGAVIFSILFLVIQLFVGLHFSFYPSLNPNTTDASGWRFPGYFYDPQVFAQFLSVSSFLFLIHPRKIEKPTFKNYFFFSIVLGAMMFTGGRSALIGLTVGLIYLFFVLGRQYRVILMVLFVATTVAFSIFTNSMVLTQRAKNFDKDLSFRASLWQEGLDVFLRNPVLGIGLGNTGNYLESHSDNYYITEDKDVFYYDSESGYLKVLTETGALGFLVSFAFILIPTFSQARDTLRKHQVQNVIKFFFIAAIFNWLVSFSSLYSLNDKRLLILIVVCISFLIAEKRKNNEAVWS